MCTFTPRIVIIDLPWFLNVFATMLLMMLLVVRLVVSFLVVLMMSRNFIRLLTTFFLLNDFACFSLF
jgi:hypothetical protein